MKHLGFFNTPLTATIKLLLHIFLLIEPQFPCIQGVNIALKSLKKTVPAVHSHAHAKY